MVQTDEFKGGILKTFETSSVKFCLVKRLVQEMHAACSNKSQ